MHSSGLLVEQSHDPFFQSEHAPAPGQRFVRFRITLACVYSKRLQFLPLCLVSRLSAMGTKESRNRMSRTIEGASSTQSFRKQSFSQIANRNNSRRINDLDCLRRWPCKRKRCFLYSRVYLNATPGEVCASNLVRRRLNEIAPPGRL